MHSLSDNTPRSVQLARRFLRGALFASLLACVAACSSTQRGPVVENSAYIGPPVIIDSSQSEHIAVFSIPSGGWRLTLDQVREAFKTQRAFVTLRRPNPGLYNTQAVVEQRVGTSVDRIQNVQVYTRILAFDDITSEVPYRLSASAPANTTPLPPRQREKPRTDTTTDSK